MKLSDVPLTPCCPNCGKGNYGTFKLGNVDVTVCADCRYILPVPSKVSVKDNGDGTYTHVLEFTDPRRTHTTDNRKAHRTDDRRARPL